MGARQAMVDRMLKALYSYFDALSEWTKDTKPCDYSPGARSLCACSEQDCIRLQIGSLLPVLNSLGLWPKRSPENVTMSPAQLRAALHGVRLSDCNNNNLKGLDRERRNSGKQSAGPACGKFEDVLNRIRDVPLHHRRHPSRRSYRQRLPLDSGRTPPPFLPRARGAPCCSRP
ncbi:hypothetical protein LZ30DRAFT_257755 [Colletotrichum cereale]|nr:hypothetical protein LZ30DRAFT_257755 [Colletotrichum cereale]